MEGFKVWGLEFRHLRFCVLGFGGRDLGFQVSDLGSHQTGRVESLVFHALVFLGFLIFAIGVKGSRLAFGQQWGFRFWSLRCGIFRV